MLVSPALLRRRLGRSSQYRIALAALLLFILDALYLVGSIPASGTQDTVSNGASRSKIFIASIHRDSAPRLHATWSDTIISLAGILGSHNVYFSAVNAHSSDATRAELLQLQRRLDDIGVGNSIAHGPTASQLEEEASTQSSSMGSEREGWIRLGDRLLMRRVPLLAALRNQALAPLQTLLVEGRTFDTVLWIDDDVVFEPHNVVDLLDTRAGDFTAACAVAMDTPSRIRDGDALRDEMGLPPASSRWPWFFSPASRAAVQSAQPVPVESCWGGLVALDAAPFYAEPPLRFRAIHDTLAEKHVEASERCLLHADNVLRASGGKGVWMNPRVRVGHDASTYESIGRAHFPGWFVVVIGTWMNRVQRWATLSVLSPSQREVQNLVQEWLSEESWGNDLQGKRQEPGNMCLMDDAQIVEPRKPFKFAWEQRR